jgi:hypothetical protein
MKMTFTQYLDAAEACRSPEDAQQLITQASEDRSVSNRQYECIRYLAIKAGHGA